MMRDPSVRLTWSHNEQFALGCQWEFIEPHEGEFARGIPKWKASRCLGIGQMQMDHPYPPSGKGMWQGLYVR
ncbi:hypothetical protein DLM20_24720, partial [Salmonella enterica subsp. enterica serovar Java]|nr:hypothetical protein [Salmonella enterica subsp. enterica serovar Java]